MSVQFSAVTSLRTRLESRVIGVDWASWAVDTCRWRCWANGCDTSHTVPDAATMHIIHHNRTISQSDTMASIPPPEIWNRNQTQLHPLSD